MATTWILVARGDTSPAREPLTPPRSAVLACPMCARAVRAYACSLREPEAREVFACPSCGALVEEVEWASDDAPALPGATLDELKEAVQQATQEAERWRCQADGARQRKDLAWADRAVAWSVAAEQRAAALRRQAETAARDDEPQPSPRR